MFFGIGKSTLLGKYFINEKKIVATMDKWKDDEIFGKYLSEKTRDYLVQYSRNYKTIVAPNADEKNRGDPSLFKYKTLVHGDFHVGNIFLPHNNNQIDDGRIYMVDWQFYGLESPSFELAYFLSSSTRFTADGHNKLVKTYYDEFRQNVKDCPQDYTLDVLEREVDQRVLSLNSTYLNILSIDSPQAARDRHKNNEKVKKAQEFLGRGFGEVLKRSEYCYSRAIEHSKSSE